MGVSEYTDKDLKLNFAANDARKMEAVFKNHSGDLYKDVQTKLIVDAEANRTGLLGGLTWLKKQMTQHDIGVVFFFSGHGDKDDTGGFYLLPSDVDSLESCSGGTAVPPAQISRNRSIFPTVLRISGFTGIRTSIAPNSPPKTGYSFQAGWGVPGSILEDAWRG